ncbi:MAG: ABC transporter ATP-binding protein [Devosia sp.]
MQSLVLSNISKFYQQYHALKDVSLSVEQGEFLVMVGPSGCGKSTLLRSIAGLEGISEGKIELNGREITRLDPSDRGVAMVFQNYALYPHMSVAQNMGFALKMMGKPRAEVDAAVNRAAAILQLSDHLNKKPRQLSGGQRQRVAIGRAITRSPELFLFDEPLSNLDAALRTQMRVELSRLHAELGATMVYVTHDQVEAMTMATRIVILNKGQIEQIGAPLALYNNPANLFVATFLGAPRMNVIAATVTSNTDATLEVALASGQPVSLPWAGRTRSQIAAGAAIRIGVRPEALGIGEGAVSLPGTVRVIENLGREALAYVDGGQIVADADDEVGRYLVVQLSAQAGMKAGDTVTLGTDPESIYVFDADGQTIRQATRFER